MGLGGRRTEVEEAEKYSTVMREAYQVGNVRESSLQGKHTVQM